MESGPSALNAHLSVIARCQEATCVCFKAVSPPNRSNLRQASSTPTASSFATAAKSRELSTFAGRGWPAALLLSGTSWLGHWVKRWWRAYPDGHVQRARCFACKLGCVPSTTDMRSIDGGIRSTTSFGRL